MCGEAKSNMVMRVAMRANASKYAGFSVEHERVGLVALEDGSKKAVARMEAGEGAEGVGADG
jgi:hypothetical protein